MKPKFLTFVAVGDRNSGKTELLLKYTGGGEYKSSDYDEYVIPRFQPNIQEIIVDRVPYMIYFLDTECDDDYEILRIKAYEEADCILLCYSIKLPTSFQNIYKKWCLEVRKYAPFTPIILIGTSSEARADPDNNAVRAEQGENLKLLIGAYAFIECSTDKSLGIDDIFIEAVRSTYLNGTRRRT